MVMEKIASPTLSTCGIEEEEAVEIRRRLAAVNPENFNAELEESLVILSIYLKDSDREDEGLSVDKEIEEVRRQLTARNRTAEIVELLQAV